MNAEANLVSFENYSNVRFIFDAEGDAYADSAWCTYDSYDDLGLIRTMEEELLAVEHPDQTERRKYLENAGIISKDSWHIEDGKQRAMVNMSKLSMLHHGALLQVGDKFDAMQESLDQRDTKIDLLDRRLNHLLEN